MSRIAVWSLGVAALALLAACGEQPQVVTGQGVKQDNPPHAGVGASQYAERGWTAGDRTSWEQQLRQRAQYGQNDYVRVGAQPK